MARVQKIDCVCLQETHCIESDLERWSNEWKNLGGGESAWNNGSRDSRGGRDFIE